MARVVLTVVLFCILLMPQLSCGAGQEGHRRANLDVQNLRNRKVLNGMEMEKMVVDESAGKYEEKQKEAESLGRELREAPMGPDPLHHNGAPPRKPRTTP